MKIGKKLILSMLALTLGTMLLICAGLWVVIGGLRDSIQTQYEDIRTGAEQTIEEGLYAQDSDSLGVLADMQVEVTDSRLQIVADAVEQSAEFAERLYASPAAYAGSAYAPVHLSEAPPTLSARYMFSADVEASAGLYEELRLLSNIEEIFAPIMRYNSKFLDNLYVGTASGIFYQYTANNVFRENYVVTQRHWYLNSVASPDEIMWKETEIDSYGRPCITASMAVRDPEGNVVAVVAADVNFEQMMSNVIGSGLGETGETFILGEERDLLAYGALMEDVKEHEALYNAFSDHFANAPDVRKKIEACAFGDGAAFHAELDGREIYMTAREIPSTGWLLCTAINAEEITQPIGAVTAASDRLFAEASRRLTNEFNAQIIKALFGVIAIAFLSAVIVYFISRTISRPIIRLTDTVKNTGEGDFDKKSEIDTRDEIGDLARSFNRMQDELRLYMEDLKTATAEKERIGAELSLATRIQASMLPNIYPAFPDRCEFDIYASMDPAREVGGDFYDFFLVDDDHLCLLIADVSGKGVPAALFMMASRIILANYAKMGLSPAQILTNTNEAVCRTNREEMFVTVWLGILEISTGRLTAANAGHEYPVLMQGNGRFDFVKDKHGFVIGGMDGIKYKEYELTLTPGSKLFLYTDGVPEATNAENELFGADRMLAALNAHTADAPQALLKNLRRAVDGFVKDAEQFDDLTMLGLEYRGK